jgi:hypothetical protein
LENQNFPVLLKRGMSATPERATFSFRNISLREVMKMLFYVREVSEPLRQPQEILLI